MILDIKSIDTYYGLDPHIISQRGIALVPETRGIFSYLTTRENLDIARRKTSRWQMDTVLDRFPLLKERMNDKGRELSGGEQEMLAIARELKNPHVSMLLVEQNAEMALHLADRVYVIGHATVVFEGTPARLRADTQVTATYPGVGS